MSKKYISFIFGIAVVLALLFGVFFRENIVERFSKSPQIEREYIEASIGYIGCSNTRETVEGYHYLGGKKMWGYDKRYDSGSVREWAFNVENENKYWRVFDALLQENPRTEIIWFQLCILNSERDTSYEYAETIIGEIRKRIPEVVIYVSPLADYIDGICDITGTWGLEKAKELTQELNTNNGDVFLGPVLGPMTSVDTARDGCHLSSPDGKRKLGSQMIDFFDRLQIGNYENESNEIIDGEISIEEQLWNLRVGDALSDTQCPQDSTIQYPQGYYLGLLTDTHLHIPSIPDWSFDDEPDEETLIGRFGGSEAYLGFNVKMSEIACAIKREGTRKNFAFFPVYDEEISKYQLEIWKETMEKYPDEFTPFIMASGNDGDPNGFPTVDAAALREMLNTYPGLFKGYGEIGLYERENGGSQALSPDSEMLRDIYHIIRGYDLVVYFHLGDGHKKAFEKVLAENPDINFVWHGDQLSVDEIEDILSNHPNAYYGVDAFWGHDQDFFLLFVGGQTKDEYLKELDENFNKILNYAVDDWKSVVERHPDQFIWGIDRGDAVWNYDVDVGRAQIRLARAFIGKLDVGVQEKIAYKNAERLLGAT